MFYIKEWDNGKHCCCCCCMTSSPSDGPRLCRGHYQGDEVRHDVYEYLATRKDLVLLVTHEADEKYICIDRSIRVILLHQPKEYRYPPSLCNLCDFAPEVTKSPAHRLLTPQPLAASRQTPCSPRQSHFVQKFLTRSHQKKLPPIQQILQPSPLATNLYSSIRSFHLAFIS